MGEIGDIIADVSNMAGKTLAASIICFILIIVAFAFFNAYLENRETLHKTAAEICGLEAKIRSVVNEELIASIPENTEQQKRAKAILIKIAWTQKVTDEEYQTVLDVLDVTEKRRLGLEDLEKICYFV